MNAIKGSWIALLAFGAAGVAVADTVILTNGSEIEGTVVQDDANAVVIVKADGTRKSIRKADVDAVVREAKPAPAPAPAPEPAKPVEAAKPADAEKKPESEKNEGDAKAEGEKKAEGEVKADGEKKDATAKPEGEKKAEDVAKAEGDKKTEADKKNVVVADAKKPDEKVEPKDPKKDKVKDPKKAAWTPPPGLPRFPKEEKRMDEAKEKEFMDALERMATTEEAVRKSAESQISGMGEDVLPYVVAGCYHASVEARSACMRILGQKSAKSAIKQVIEVFYAVMPDNKQEAAATYQVPFVREIKSTLQTITGQSFINVEAERVLVQDGLEKYIKWYNDNVDRLPARQYGEEELEKSDPEYAKKLAKTRELKLERLTWPRPPLPSDITQGQNKNNNRAAVTPKELERPSDRNYRDTIPKLSREDALKRSR
jgi:hypothetical protein